MNYADICSPESGRVALQRVPNRGFPLTTDPEVWRIPQRFREPPPEPEPALPKHTGPRLPAPGTETRRLYDIMLSRRGEKLPYVALCDLMHRAHESGLGSLLAALKRHNLVRSEGTHLRMLWWAP